VPSCDNDEDCRVSEGYFCDADGTCWAEDAGEGEGEGDQACERLDPDGAGCMGDDDCLVVCRCADGGDSTAGFCKPVGTCSSAADICSNACGEDRGGWVDGEFCAPDSGNEGEGD